MPIPSPRTDVPKETVGEIVAAMLTNPDVGDISCELQSDGKYRITPRARS